MKKLLLIVLGALLVAQPSDAQFFKKLFKKKAKTEKKKKSGSKADGIDDDAQVAMADWATVADNQNNRNAFLNIPLGIKADRFEKSLMEQNFTERKPEGKQTAKSYVYEGDVYGAKSIVILATTDQTARVYAVDVEEEQIYPSLQAVQQRFQELKKQLTGVYGQGFIDNQGEAYTIQTRLGTVSLHYERGSLTSSYTIGFTLDDAKAYNMAYGEMDAEDKEYEDAPRSIDYQASVSMARKKQNITSVAITATDDVTAICKDLQTYGFTSSDQKTWRQGNMTVVVSNDKQGRVVVTLR